METRMYRSLGGIWHGFSKNALEIMHAPSVARIGGDALTSFGLAVGVILPVLVLLGEQRGASLIWNLSAAVSFITLAMLAGFFALCLRVMRVPMIYVIAFPVGLCMHGAIILNAWFRLKTGSRKWKGRQY